MLRFILSRFGQTLAVLFMASVIVFALMRLIPGDPVLMMLGDDFTQVAYERMKAQLGLGPPDRRAVRLLAAQRFAGGPRRLAPAAPSA
jgi:ABC-type dipeptide/oligopeptide/nickel transport system permease component